MHRIEVRDDVGRVEAQILRIIVHEASGLHPRGNFGEFVVFNRHQKLGANARLSLGLLNCEAAFLAGLAQGLPYGLQTLARQGATSQSQMTLA